MIEFVHLHVHSDFSLLDGAASVENLADKAASLGMKHLAITDHGNMFGVLEFITACQEDREHKPRENPIHPIIGCEFYMASGSRFEKKGSESGNKYYHLVLLAASREGYLNLVKLSSYAYTEGFYFKPRIDEELLVKYHKGLIGLSACIAGEIPSLLLEGKAEEAEKRAVWFSDLLGPDNFYLELQDHRLEPQKKANPLIADISRRRGIPLVATNDIHYLERDDAVAQDILLCISTNKKRSEVKRLRFDTDEFYFKTGDEMAALFKEYPEAISNTVKIAERCITDVPMPGPLLPDFAIPAGFAGSASPFEDKVRSVLEARSRKKGDPPDKALYSEDEIPAGQYLWHLTVKGLQERYGGRFEDVKGRAEYELRVIIQMGFTGYFLIVADFINWAKENAIPVGPGRGSGAGSIVAYSLRITDIDPLKYNLLFERFLNPERISMPDFDVDFCFERREEVIKYVTEKYGKDRVGQIITFGTLKAKAVIKDVARALGISLDESNMIAKLIPDDPKMTLKKAFTANPALRELEQDAKYKELFAIARKLEGKKRHSSLHAAGIVIGKSELSDYVPLYRDAKTGIVATQFTMGLIEDRGLVKMDFLGLKTLTLIKHTEDLIRLRGGNYAGFNITDIDEHDEAAFLMLGEGKSAGVFQFESEGMQKILKDARPSSIEDLIALNALYRPGPMDNIPQFIDSKWGRQAIKYPDPSLEGILKETYGVIVYQEQVMQVAQIIAGYSLGQADLLRRAMGKKKMEVMVKEKAKFVSGAVKRGYRESDAGRIFDILIPFAGYGFNKSHAAAYSVLAYQTAYLKANFPAEFMAANLTNEINNTDKLPEYIDEARQMGITIESPDVNQSDKLFTVVDGRIVYGFLGIKGVGAKPAEEIVACRGDGPYRNFIDFLSRVDIHKVGKKVIELLILTGAFDSLGQTRECLRGNLEKAVEYTENIKEDKKFGQTSLFGDTEEKEYPDFQFEEFAMDSRENWLKVEKELIGFYFSGHPMDNYRAVWKHACTLNLAEIEKAQDGEYTLVGIIKSMRTLRDKNKNEMAFASIADYRGEADLVFFSKAWEKCKQAIEPENIVALKGRIRRSPDKKRDKPSVEITAVLDMDRLERAAARSSAKNEEHDGTAETPALSAAAGLEPYRQLRDSGARIVEPAGAAHPSAAQEPPRTDGNTASQAYRELHIRLNSTAAQSDENLYPIRNYLTGNPGSCTVFIHVPLAEGEAVIRTTTEFKAAAGAGQIGDLRHCAGVAMVWGE
ncbi:MAG: DNA polymerase III subunit alpha [Treponema sp.]|jgi:DNA polymerase-3 subunit alpha|nr:DNA polymerase III subunit alpha [Treponema sp.]